jgi:citrate lyase subunit beta / citryl-CoA lyase
VSILVKLRSMLFVPGDDARKLDRACDSQADALILDLEDAVAPERKAEARRLCAEFLDGGRRQPVFVRVNPVCEEALFDDLAAIIRSAPDGIMLPKCTGPDDLSLLDHALTALEVRDARPCGSIVVLPIAIEVAESAFTAGRYRGVTPRLCGLMWGVEDIAVDIGSAVRGESGAYLPAVELARSLCVYAAAAAGVPAVDAVYANFKDLEGLARDVASARESGFTVKTAIHPAQVPVINRELTPSADAISWAARVVHAFGKSPGRGAIAIDGRMHDRPHLRAAEMILARGNQGQ